MSNAEELGGGLSYLAAAGKQAFLSGANKRHKTALARRWRLSVAVSRGRCITMLVGESMKHMLRRQRIPAARSACSLTCAALWQPSSFCSSLEVMLPPACREEKLPAQHAFFAGITLLWHFQQAWQQQI